MARIIPGMTRTLSESGPRVSDLGLGCMGMSDLYGAADRRESIATIHAAMDAGITLLDTGDFYGMGANELLIREALRSRDRGHMTMAQVAIAWVLSRGDDVVPLVGARRRDRLHEALGALRLGLSREDFARIEEAVPAGAAAGERYPAPAMEGLDSERRDVGVHH
jgi:aryl-alcohol dehydrogenase-like predicted oxidoreductase